MKTLLSRLRGKQTVEDEVVSSAAGPMAAVSEAKNPSDAVLAADISEPAVEPPPAVVAAAPAAGHDVKLELGHFLNRIPADFLKPGPHDPKLEVRLDATEIGTCIARGLTSIPLTRLYECIPQIFRAPIPEGDATEIRLPWQKLRALSGPVAAMVARSADEMIVRELRDRNSSQGLAATEPPPPQVNGNGTLAPSWYSPRPPTVAAADDGNSQPLQDSAPAGALIAVPITRPVKPALAKQGPGAEEAATVARERQQDLLHMGEQVALQLANFKQEQEQQLAAVAEGRAALGEQWMKTLAELERVRNELAERNIDLNERAPGDRATTQKQADAHARKLPELERLIQSSELKLADSTRDRDALSDLKSHIVEQFEQLSHARRDLEEAHQELDVKSAEMSALAEQARATALALERAKQDGAELLGQKDALAAELAAAIELASTAGQAEGELRTRIAEMEQAAEVSAFAHRETTAELELEREARMNAERSLADIQASSGTTAETLRAEHAQTIAEIREQAARTEEELRNEVASLIQASSDSAAERKQHFDALLRTEKAAAETRSFAEGSAAGAASREPEIRRFMEQLSELQRSNESVRQENQLLAARVGGRAVPSPCLQRRGAAAKRPASHRAKAAPRLSQTPQMAATRERIKVLMAERDARNAHGKKGLLRRFFQK